MLDRTSSEKLQLAEAILAGCLAVFLLYTAIFGGLQETPQRSTFVGLGLLVCIISAKAGKGRKLSVYDVVFIVLGLAACVNAFVKHHTFFLFPTQSTPLDQFLGLALAVLMIELGRRTVGWVFPALTILAILYALFGPIFPGRWTHRGISIVHLLTTVYQGGNGIWGFLTGLGAGVVGMFLIFGALILGSGAGQSFINLALRLVGGWRGGGAKAATVSSALFGMVSGSSAVNVAVTGNLTIPLMKRSGMEPAYAAGVEAAASTAGQYTPPIMGASAFIIAEMMGVPYLDVIRWAALPALLFFSSALCMIHLEAVKKNLPAIPKEEILSWRQILTYRQLGPIFFSVVILIALLLTGYSATKAGGFGIASFLFLYVFSSFSFIDTKKRLVGVWDLLVKGGEAAAQLMPLLVCANIIVNLIGLTGVAVKVTELMVGFGMGKIVFVIITGAAATVVLGMGMPTSAAFILTSAILAPALSEFGIAPQQVYIFIFIFACLSAITPPVCAAAYVGGQIANASWWKVAIIAMRLSLAAYVVPFILFFNPALLMEGSPVFILLSVLGVFTGVLLIAIGFIGSVLRQNLLVVARVLVSIGGILILFLSTGTISSRLWPWAIIVTLAILGLAFLSNRSWGLILNRFGLRQE